MDHAPLFEIAKLLLLSQDEPERTIATIVQRLLEASQAERGFIVVREGKSFEEKLNVEFERGVSDAERRFSRSVVKKAIASGELLVSNDVSLDPRLSGIESIQSAGPHAVLVVPLRHEQEVYGVVYLERLVTKGGFSPEAAQFAAEFAELAALSLRRATEREALRKRNQSLEHDLFAQHDFRGIVTRNPGMLKLLKLVAQVADSDATVLIRGETGTGKELIARALHMNSRRVSRPLAVLHCTALPATILESELFGHAKGAFTGADRDRAGRIAVAQGGTLFLDEIAEIPPEGQAKLLRFLQFGEIQRIGSDRTEKVDVRIVAATHESLEQLVEAGKFRQDLYYRLKVIEIELPPLRERMDDLSWLVDSFCEELGRGPEKPRFTPAAMAALRMHDYPGNVRELRHLVERACVLATGPALDLDLLPPELSALAPPASSEESVPSELEHIRRAASDAAERDFLSGLLQRSQGNISLAARSSGIHRSYLQRLMSKHGLRRG